MSCDLLRTKVPQYILVARLYCCRSPYLQPCDIIKTPGANQTENAGSHSPVSPASKDSTPTISADETSMATMTAMSGNMTSAAAGLPPVSPMEQNGATSEGSNTTVATHDSPSDISRTNERPYVKSMSGNTTSGTDELLGTLRDFLDGYVNAAEDRLKQSADGGNPQEVLLTTGNDSQATQVLMAEIRLDGASPGEIIRVDESLSPSTGGTGGSINGSITVAVVREGETSSSRNDVEVDAAILPGPPSTFPSVGAMDGPEDTDLAGQGSLMLPGFWDTIAETAPLAGIADSPPSGGIGLPSAPTKADNEHQSGSGKLPSMPVPQQPTPALPVATDGTISTSEAAKSDNTGDDDDSHARPSSLTAAAGAALLVIVCVMIAAEVFGGAV